MPASIIDQDFGYKRLKSLQRWGHSSRNIITTQQDA